jgi:iron complex transport system permease protein
MYSTRHRTVTTSLLLALVVLLTGVFSLAVGTVPIPPIEVIRWIGGAAISEEHRTILASLRLPRTLLAIIVGGGLSVAGAVFQALLRNPLAEPFILGVSSGGTLGAIIAISFGIGLTFVTIPTASFVGSLGVMILVYAIASRYGRIDPTTLLLAGVIIGAFFNALILTLAAIFHTRIHNAFLWLMGNLGSADIRTLSVVAPVVVVVSAIFFAMSRYFNLIATGEETAAQLGVNVELLKRGAYVLASLLTGVVVSVSGVIGFVGLIVPHACRIVVGADHRQLLPASFFTGAAFLTLVDVASRTVISPSEIPVGAVTAVVGVPVFVWLLRRET